MCDPRVHSHVSPNGWLLLLPIFTDKETETQRMKELQKMQQKEAVKSVLCIP